MGFLLSVLTLLIVWILYITFLDDSTSIISLTAVFVYEWLWQILAAMTTILSTALWLNYRTARSKGTPTLSRVLTTISRVLQPYPGYSKLHY